VRHNWTRLLARRRLGIFLQVAPFCRVRVFAVTPPRAVDCRNYACSCRLYFSFFIRVLFCSFSALRFFCFVLTVCPLVLWYLNSLFLTAQARCSHSLPTHTHTHTTGHAYYATQSELSSYRSGLVFFLLALTSECSCFLLGEEQLCYPWQCGLDDEDDDDQPEKLIIFSE